MKKLQNTVIITSAANITSNYEYDSILKDGITYDTLRINSLNILSKTSSGTTKGYINIDYEYDQYNNINRVIYNNDGVISRIEGFTYDEFNQLTNYYEYYNGIISNTSYTYDARGNTIPNSKKNKVLAFINSLPLTITQKKALIEYSGYKPIDKNTQSKPKLFITK